MRYIDEARTIVFVEAARNTWDASPADSTMPVEMLEARGLNIADVEPYQRFATQLDALGGLTADIKREARRRILSIADDDKQRNMLARANELVLAHSMGQMTDADALEMAQLQGIWGRIKALRAFSNELEATLPALSPEQLALYDAASKAWPE